MRTRETKDELEYFITQSLTDIMIKLYALKMLHSEAHPDGDYLTGAEIIKRAQDEIRKLMEIYE